MQHLACLAVVLLVLAPLVSRTLGSSAGFFDVALCHSGTAQPALPGLIFDAAKAHAVASLATVGTGAADAWPRVRHDIQERGGQVAFACDYCVLAARLLPCLLIVLVLFALLRTRLAGERIAVNALPAVRWRAHAPRGPPLLA